MYISIGMINAVVFIYKMNQNCSKTTKLHHYLSLPFLNFDTIYCCLSQIYCFYFCSHSLKWKNSLWFNHLLTNQPHQPSLSQLHKKDKCVLYSFWFQIIIPNHPLYFYKHNKYLNSFIQNKIMHNSRLEIIKYINLGHVNIQ
jgi:hypothetical protein